MEPATKSPALAAECGPRVLIVTGRRSLKASGNLDEMLGGIRDAGLEPFVFDAVEAEPLVETVDHARDMALDEEVDVVVAIGGGSARSMSARPRRP